MQQTLNLEVLMLSLFFFFSAYLVYPDLEVTQNNWRELSALSFGRANESLWCEGLEHSLSLGFI